MIFVSGTQAVLLTARLIAHMEISSARIHQSRLAPGELSWAPIRMRTPTTPTSRDQKNGKPDIPSRDLGEQLKKLSN